MKQFTRDIAGLDCSWTVDPTSDQIIYIHLNIHTGSDFPQFESINNFSCPRAKDLLK